MASLKLLVENFLDENKCCPTLLDAWIPEVIAWVDKNVKLNVSDSGSFTGIKLSCLNKMSSQWPLYVRWPMGRTGCPGLSSKRHARSCTR